MTLIEIDDSGNKTEYNNVVDWNCWTDDEVKKILKDNHGGMGLSDGLRSEIGRELGKLERFPDYVELEHAITCAVRTVKGE